MKLFNWKNSGLALAFGLFAPTAFANTAPASGFEAVGNTMETMRSATVDYELVVRDGDRRDGRRYRDGYRDGRRDRWDRRDGRRYWRRR